MSGTTLLERKRGARERHQTRVRQRDRPGREGLAALAFLSPAIVLVAAIFLYPVGRVIWDSLHETYSGDFVGWQNYRSLFSDPIFHDAVRNNLKLLVVLPIIIVVALLIAQVLFDRVRGWRIYRALVFLPYVVPVVVAAIVFGQLLQSNGLFNTMLRSIGLGFLANNWLGDPHTAIWSVGGVVVWRELAFGVILFLARMTQLPGDLYDAAKVDGAGWWQRLRHITVPQMTTIIAFYAGIIVIALLNWVFNYVLVLTKGGPGTSTYVVEYYVYTRAFTYGDFGNAAALATVMLVLILGFMVTFVTWLSRRGTL